MMSEAEVRAIVEENIRDLAMALQLGGWRLILCYDGSLGQDGASCSPDPMRHIATITFNPGEFNDEKQVLNALLHELLHIYHAEFDLYRDAVKATVSSEVFAALDATYQNGCEHVVDNVLSLLTLTFKTSPKKLIAAQRRREARS